MSVDGRAPGATAAPAGGETPVLPRTAADRWFAVAAASAMLARLVLAPIDAPLVRELITRGRTPWPLLDDDPARIALAEELGRAMVEVGGGSSDDLSSALVRLDREYERLFRGPGHVVAAPYESVHTTEEHLVFQGPTSQVRDAYAAHGLATPFLFREPDDHIGLELHFIAHLAERLATALEARVGGSGGSDGGAPDAARALFAELSEFCDAHLLRFADDVADAMSDESTEAVYRCVGDLLRVHLHDIRLLLR